MNSADQRIEMTLSFLSSQAPRKSQALISRLFLVVSPLAIPPHFSVTATAAKVPD